MPKLIFRGATIRFVDLRCDEKSKTCYTKINFTADFSEPVREAMEWGEPPAAFASADLDGEMVASHLILTPNGRELKQHELSLDAREISGFKFVRVNGEQEGSTHNELRFQVTSVGPDAAPLLAQYLSIIGKGAGQLRVNYEQQSEMEMEADDKQERLISEEQAEDTAEEGDGAALASAAVMGGTHQKGARRKARTEPVN